MNLEALDAAIDAVEQPKYILVSKWWSDFYCADRRKRGRLIRQLRRKKGLEAAGLETNLTDYLIYTK